MGQQTRQNLGVQLQLLTSIDRLLGNCRTSQKSSTCLGNAYPTFSATCDSAYSCKRLASLLNLRTPSASFSVAIASSLCIQRKLLSFICKRSSLESLALA